jgi:hypothetical protein
LQLLGQPNTILTTAPEEIVEYIVDTRLVSGARQYRVRWQGYDQTDDTWEPRENVEGCVKLVEFDAAAAATASTLVPKAEAKAKAKAAAPAKATKATKAASPEAPPRRRFSSHSMSDTAAATTVPKAKPKLNSKTKPKATTPVKAAPKASSKATAKSAGKAAVAKSSWEDEEDAEEANLRAAKNPRADIDSADRIVLCTNAEYWLDQQLDGSIESIVTGMPDFSETDMTDVAVYEAWFVRMAKKCLKKLCVGSYAIFCQTDRRIDSAVISKSSLLVKAATAADVGAKLCWHKIVLRCDVGAVDIFRPTFSHLMAFSMTRGPGQASADVIPASEYPHKNAFPKLALELSLSFLQGQVSGLRVVCDPFCGKGTVLAAANQRGLRAIGVDILESMCEHAQML